MSKHVLEFGSGGFRVRAGAGKSGQNLKFVRTAW